MTAIRFALTFDAEHPDRPGWRPGVEEALLDGLADLGVRATFFVQGRWAEAAPATARRIAVAGHLVGSHGFYHVRLPLLSDDGLGADIGQADRTIEEIVGVSARPWFRCPFGAGADDPRVLAAIASAGYRHVGWDASGEDWRPGRSGARIAAEAASGALAHGDGAIVLLHAWPEATLEALPELVGRLTDTGGRFVTVDQVLTGIDVGVTASLG